MVKKPVNSKSGFRNPLVVVLVSITIGLVSSLIIIIIGISAYNRAIEMAHMESQKDYLYEIDHFTRFVESLETKDDKLALESSLHYYNSLRRKLVGEYICIVDTTGHLILHTSSPETIGNLVGKNQILNKDGQKIGDLYKLISEKSSFLGDYLSSNGENQLAAFSYSKSRNWLIGVHRSKDSIKKMINDRYRWILLLFLPLGFVFIPLSYLTIFYAVSKLYKNEVELRKAMVIAKDKAEESDRLKSAFVANISHDIRTPLNGILGFSELLMENGLSRDEKEKYYSLVRSGSDQLIGIVQNIINISVIESGNLSPSLEHIKIGPVFENLFHQFNDLNRNPKIQILLNKGPEMKLYTDKNLFIQVLSNLINNALKYTEEGSVEFGYTLDKSTFIGFVKDSGKGIPKSIGDKVFERFHRIKDNKQVVSGSGLGLFICKAIIHCLSGEIWYESVVGKGSTFYFSIPTKKS